MAGSRSLGTGNPPPGRLAVPAGGMGVVGRGRGAATSSLSLARPSPRGSACGCPSDLQPAKYPLHEGDARGTVPTTETRVPFSCPSGAPRSREDTVPRCCGRKCCCQARDPSPPPRLAPGYSRAAGSSLSDNPSRWMSPSSMARLAARSGAPGRTGSRRGVTSSSCAPRARVSAPSSGREGTVPLLPRRRTRSCARGEPNLAARARALPLLPLSFLGWGVPSRPPAPRRIPAGTALAPPRAAQLRAVSHPTPTRSEERASARPGRWGLTAARSPACPPPPLRGRVATGPGPRRASYQSGWLVGPAGKAPRWGRGIATQPRETEMMAEQARAHAPGPSPPGGRTPIHPFWMCQRGGEALAWQGELEVTGQAAASI